MARGAVDHGCAVPASAKESGTTSPRTPWQDEGLPWL